jgi:hypothetical protein
MPLPDEIFDQMGGSSIYSILDMRQGFNQIEIEEEDKHKTAYWASNRRYEWNVMPFGLKNAPAVFQKVMDAVLGPISFARCYIDDVIVASSSVAQHCEHLRYIFEVVYDAGLRCHPSKCLFGSTRVPYLGHMVSVDGLGPQQAKIDAIAKMVEPGDASTLRSFLGLANYYRKFVQNFSSIAKPLNSLLQKNVSYVWGVEQQSAFDALKAALVSAPILRPPDFSLPFVLQTDWGKPGIGAVLSQKDREGEEYVVAYASRSNNQAESNYSSYEGECLAAVWAVQHFRHYLYGRRFILLTDHQPLSWLMTNEKLIGKLARWALILQEYDFEVIHRAGLQNLNADGLSRNPLESTEDNGVRQDHDRVPVSSLEYDLGGVIEEAWVPTPTVAPQAASQWLVGTLPPLVVPLSVAAGRVVSVDVWSDAPLLYFLKHRQHEPALSAIERRRVQKRASHFVWSQGAVFRVFPEGLRLVVPRPFERHDLMSRVHEEMGHFGVKRTISLVRQSFWWDGMYRQIADFVRACPLCDRVKTAFSAKSPVLHPLPIMGMFYRWSLDLAGPLPRSRRGKLYALVMIEHFSKWLELVALPSKEPRHIATAFTECVLTRYGAPAEVLTDQGTEFRGEFQDLLDESFIDHRLTSRNHPQADGLAERMVQTVKVALRKYALDRDVKDWDVMLPFIAMGYRMSRQSSLSSFSPYYLLYGRDPILGVSLQRRCAPVVDLDDPSVWLDVVTDRASAFARELPMAMDNLLIAQHRDTQRYATVRSGSYRPKMRKFEVGDYVYLRRQTLDTLDVDVSPRILQVAEVKATGVLSLRGSDGRVVSEHMSNCAPCFLPELDASVDPTRAPVSADLPCTVCGRIDGDDTMLLCDGCNAGYHMECLMPPLLAIPAGDWFCGRCSG